MFFFLKAVITSDQFLLIVERQILLQILPFPLFNTLVKDSTVVSLTNQFPPPPRGSAIIFSYIDQRDKKEATLV